MTDKEIIKALGCCIKDDCDNCPNTFGNCEHNLMSNALAYINQLEADLQAMRMSANSYKMHCEKLEAEVDRLKPLEENLDKLLYMLNTVDMEQSVLEEQKHTIKSEAIKEFAGKIADVFCSHDKGDAYVREVVYNLVKEMVGEQR